jgi:hypothetical protein
MKTITITLLMLLTLINIALPATVATYFIPGVSTPLTFEPENDELRFLVNEPMGFEFTVAQPAVIFGHQVHTHISPPNTSSSAVFRVDTSAVPVELFITDFDQGTANYDHDQHYDGHIADYKNTAQPYQACLQDMIHKYTCATLPLDLQTQPDYHPSTNPLSMLRCVYKTQRVPLSLLYGHLDIEEMLERDWSTMVYGPSPLVLTGYRLNPDLTTNIRVHDPTSTTSILSNYNTSRVKVIKPQTEPESTILVLATTPATITLNDHTSTTGELLYHNAISGTYTLTTEPSNVPVSIFEYDKQWNVQTTNLTTSPYTFYHYDTILAAPPGTHVTITAGIVTVAPTSTDVLVQPLNQHNPVFRLPLSPAPLSQNVKLIEGILRRDDNGLYIEPTALPTFEDINYLAAEPIAVSPHSLPSTYHTLATIMGTVTAIDTNVTLDNWLTVVNPPICNVGDRVTITGVYYNNLFYNKVF